MDAYVQCGLEALGDATRFAIFERLGAGPQSVGQLAAGLPVSRPAVSQHLRVLKTAGLVRDEKAGTRRFYERNPQGIKLLCDHFNELWEQALSAFKKAAEAEYQKEKQHDSRSSPRRRGKSHAPGGRTH